jgi:GNAT superfamily N-acetyltransferase
MLERRIEEASLNSWPALQQMHFDGWLLRFAGEYTKRANSVTPLYPALQPILGKIEVCEKIYKEKQQPTIFRLPSFLPVCRELDHALSLQQYEYIDHTTVFAMKLDIGAQVLDRTIHQVSLTEWIAIFCQLSQRSIDKHHVHKEMLTRIASRTLFAVLSVGMIPVACGLGVLENDVFGIFDVVTSLEQRKKGFGTRLVNEMLDWGRENNATCAYIQVVDSNEAAWHVYEHLGFQPLYYYWYRVRS